MDMQGKQVIIGEELISIIVPIYNASLTLKRCIESIKNQTYHNVEIILVNDGSTDDSLDICNGYKVIDNRVVVINKSNSGVSEARNDGIRKSSGKYLLFVDADDYVDHDYVETLYRKMVESNVDIVISNAIDFNESGDMKSKNIVKGDMLLSKFETLKELFSEKYFHGVCWGKLFTRDVLVYVSFDKNMRIAEDLKFLNDVCSNVNSALVITERKYHYFAQQGSATRSGFNEGWLDEINFCHEISNKHKGTSLEKYSVKRYMRVLIDCLYNFDLNSSQIKLLEDHTKALSAKCLFGGGVSIKHKIKYILSVVKRVVYT